MSSRAQDPIGSINLDHAIADICTDPDCEIHNPWVGYQEGTVGRTELAFYIAGHHAGSAALADQHDSVKRDLIEDFMNEGVIDRPKEAE